VWRQLSQRGWIQSQAQNPLDFPKDFASNDIEIVPNKILRDWENAWCTVMYPPDLPAHTNNSSIYRLDAGCSRAICRSSCSLSPFSRTSRTCINYCFNTMDEMAECFPIFVASSVCLGSIWTRLWDEMDRRTGAGAISCPNRVAVFMVNCAERI